MNPGLIYIGIAVLILVIVFVVLALTDRNIRGQKLSPLAGLAFGLVLAGLIFSEKRLLGYGLLGAGILLALVDVWLKRSRNQ